LDSGAETTRLLVDEHDAYLDGLTDIKRNGETANPWDARANAADDNCLKQR